MVEDGWWTPRPLRRALLRAGAGGRQRRRRLLRAGLGPLVPAAGLMPASPRLHRAALPLGLLLPGRGLGPGRAGGAAADLGYAALALTDHDRVWGAMEFAHACEGVGVRPIAGAELTVDAAADAAPGPPHPVGRGREAASATSAGCSPRAHAHTRDGAPARSARHCRRSLSIARSSAHAEGLVCLSGCARDGPLAGAWERGDPAGAAAAARRLLERLRPRPLPGRAAAALLAPRPAAQPLARRARRAARGRRRRDRQRPLPTTAAAPTSRTPSSRCGWGRPWRSPSRCAAATRSSALLPAADGGALRRAPRGGRRDRCASPSACASTSPRSSATATRARRTPAPTASWPSSAGLRLGRALPGRPPTAPRPSGGSTKELGTIRNLGLSGFFLLHQRHARAGPRGRGARCAARTRRAPSCRPGAAAAPASARSSAT